MTGRGEEGTTRVILKAPKGAAGGEIYQRVVGAGYDCQIVETDDDVLTAAGTNGMAACVFHLSTLSADDARLVDLLQELRRRHSDSCLLAVGPDIGAEAVSALLRSGLFDYLVFPVAPGRLEQALEQGLEIRRSFLRVQTLSERLRASHLELARERDALRRWNQDLIRLNELAQDIAGTHEADHMVELASDRLDAIVPFEVLGVCWQEPAGIWIKSPVTPTLDSVHDMRHALLALGAGQTVSGRWRRDPDAGVDGPSAAVLEIPLMAGHAIAGWLRLVRGAGGEFDGREREILTAVSRSLALGLKNAAAHRALGELARRDGLTNVLNRRAFDSMLAHELKAAARYRSPLCLLLVDVDHFKAVNDRFGHPAGDALLRQVAQLLTDSLRSVDLVARYGGEEFGIILPRTSRAAAGALAQRILDRIARQVFVIQGATLRLTVSIGLAAMSEAAPCVSAQLISWADKALYEAKAAGRNRVVCYAEDALPVSAP
ncbi:GGDEF domain-containing response regulator [Candidatus Nitrospira bockiana]